MGYEKKYKNALEWAKQVMNGETGFIRKEVEQIFPELKESDGERIRKEIIYFLNRNTFQFGEDIDKYKSWIVWLEKQGEKSTDEMIETLRTEYEKGRADTIAEMQKPLTVDIDSMVEAYEQRLKSQGGIENSPLVDMCLTAFRRGIENALEELNLKKITNEDIKDLLRTEYEKGKYDAIAEMQNEQKFTWSEEDEKIYQSIMDDTVQENQLDDKQIYWLKSLRHRKQWKPSDEQI